MILMKGMDTNSKKAIVSWAMYDWANSAFATTVMAGFFPVFFKQYWSAGTDPVISTARLGLGISLAGIIIALSAPIFGAIADRGSSRKAFLIFFAFLGALFTSSLFLIPKGAWMLAVGVYGIATMGFSGANTFYDSLIPSIADEKKYDSVSALGYGLGYLGGGLLFAINVWMTLRPETFGLESQAQAVKFSFLSAGIWWMVFTLPLIFFVHEKRHALSAQKFIIQQGLKNLVSTIREIRGKKTVSLFLIAYWLYIDGVDTIVRMAVDYGLSLGFEAGDLISALLLTQFIGFPSAIFFGFLGRKIGTKRSILAAVCVYLFISFWGGFISSKQEFYVLAAIIGLVQGGIQALSRSFYARIIPEGKSAEYFGFYNMLGKFAVIFGPVLIGITGLIARSLGVEGDTASRLGICSIALLFITGGIIFSFIGEEKRG